MLFELTNSLINYTPEQQKDVVRAVTNLLIGLEEGNLLLQSELIVIEHFSDKISDERAKQALKYLERTIMSQQYEELTYKIRVVLGDPKYGELRYDFFKYTTSIQKTNLLCENQNDCEFYLKIARERYYEYNIAANEVSGGGNTTATELKKKLSKQEITLAIIDSDKHYSSAQLGATAGQCKAKYGDVKRTNCRLKILPTFEVENLIPLGFVVRHCHENHKGADFICKLKNTNLLKILRYYDYKLGATMDSCLVDDKYMSYVGEIYQQLYPRQNFENYIKTLKRQKRQDILPAFNKDMLTIYLKCKAINNHNYDYNYDALDTNTKYREDICKLVLHYCCVRGIASIY